MAPWDVELGCLLLLLHLFCSIWLPPLTPKLQPLVVSQSLPVAPVLSPCPCPSQQVPGHVSPVGTSSCLGPHT